MWLWVTVITFVIGAIWIALIKYNISTSLIEISENSKDGLKSLTNLSQDFEEQMDMEKIFYKITTSTFENNTTSTSPAIKHETSSKAEGGDAGSR